MNCSNIHMKLTYEYLNKGSVHIHMIKNKFITKIENVHIFDSFFFILK